MNKKNSFIMLKEWGEQLQFLDDHQIAELMRMIFFYQEHPEDIPISDYPIVNSIFLTMRNFFDASEERYSEACETNRKNGSKGGAPKGNQNAKKQPKTTENNRKQPNKNNQTTETTETTLSESESEYEYDTESEPESESEPQRERAPKGARERSAQRRPPFKPPEVDEVEAYIAEKGYCVDAQRFVDHYTSNGWMVGKNKMRDWKAAVRTWQSRDANAPPGKVRLEKSFAELADELSGGIL